MAKAKKKTTTVITSEGDELDVTAPAVDMGDDDVIAGLLALDGSDGIRYTVHKEPTKPGEKRAYCNTYSSEELSLDAIRSTFGGGTYRITGRDAQNQYTTSKQVTILDLPKPPAVLNGGEYLARGERSSSEALTILTKMFESQSAMLSAVLSRPPAVVPPGPSAMELVSLIKALSPDKGSDPVKTLLDGLKLGRELGGSSETGMMDVALKGFEALQPLLAAQAQAHPAPVAQAPAAPRLPHPSPPINPAPPQKTEAEMDLLNKLNWLKATAASLCMQASKNKDPELYAEVMMDNLPPFVTEEEIYERMSAPDAVAQLAKVHPGVAQYAEWFTRFRQAVLDSFDEEAPDGGELEP
jgi:hypothetical protein